MQNPFNITFGVEPSQYINRDPEFREIVNNFNGDSSSQVYLITGVRGSGKTVFLSTICDHFKNESDWIVVEVNPERNMLESLAAKIYDKAHNKFKFHVSEFSFSFNGLTINLSGENKISDVESLLENMLSYLKKKDKKVLVAIDEATNSKEMKEFAHSFQILLRQKLPLYCIMTGLFENVRSLEDEKSLTFLYRAPKITLEHLDILKIANSFRDSFNIDYDYALKLAKLTKGYAYAYQVLGYLLFNKKDNQLDDNVLSQYDAYLENHVYDKIWSSCPPKEKEILMALTKTDETSYIIIALDITKSAYCSYRDRLIKKGVVVSKEWGKLEFNLPRFEEFIIRKTEF